MSQSAHVASIEALDDFRASLCTFGDEAMKTMLSVQFAIQRTLDWLGDQLHYWQKEVRRREDAVVQARAELARRKMVRIGDRAPDCTEQEAILRRAQHRLAEAEEKLAATRRWLPALQREVDEYQGPARQLTGFLEAEHVQVLALLRQKIEVLEAYVRLAAPEPPAAAPPAE